MSPKKNILIVLDSLYSSLLKNILPQNKANIFQASHYDEVEQLIDEHNFDILISNLAIDGVFINNYIQFLNEKLPYSIIIIVTEIKSKQIQKEISQLGIEEYVTLPIEPEILFNTIEKYL
jgi:response regulator RpfG family c-di-GMP phosphodiesterase